MNRPALTVAEAAEAAGVHRRTITRRIDANRLPNAYKNSTGEWRVPIADLEASGLRLYAPAGPDPEPASTLPHDGIEVDELKAEVAEWRRRAEVAEALAAERERALERADLALRALSAGPQQGEHQADEPRPATSSTRRWRWRR